MIPSLDADVTQTQLEDSIRSNVGGHFPIEKINENLFMVESKLYIFFFLFKIAIQFDFTSGCFIFFRESRL